MLKIRGRRFRPHKPKRRLKMYNINNEEESMGFWGAIGAIVVGVLIGLCAPAWFVYLLFLGTHDGRN